jgi:hypothetical protein
MHFNISLMAELQQIAERVSSVYPHPNPLQGWVNGQLYCQTKEQFGIARTPSTIIEGSGMQFYDHAKSAGLRLQFLAQQQNTLYAITMVCHDDEKRLFRQLKRDNVSFIRNNFHQGAVIWNAKANGKTIFYKV